MTSQNFHGGNRNVLYSQYDSERVANIFKLQLFFMRFMGQIPMNFNQYFPKSFQWLSNNIAKLFCTFCVLSSFHIALLFLKTTYDVLQERKLEEITDALTLAIIYLFATFANSYLLLRSRKVSDFIGDINARYRHHSMAGLTFVSAKRSIALAHKITKYWLLSCLSGVGCWGLAPLLMRSHTLPLNCWYPFDPLKPIVYEILYVVQLWCQLLMGCTFGIGSAIFVSIAILMLGQFDVLFCSLKNLDYHAHIIAGKSMNELQLNQKKLLPISDNELNQYAFSSEHLTDLTVFKVKKQKTRMSFRNALHESLIECVHMHQFILKCCDTLEDLYNPFCLVKSIQITLQLCLLAFVGVSGELSFMRSLTLVQYLVLTLSELLMFTYCGELLKIHSVRAGEAFWRSRWWISGQYIKRDILIFLINSRRVVRVTAGKFYEMDVERLRSVITHVLKRIWENGNNTRQGIWWEIFLFSVCNNGFQCKIEVLYFRLIQILLCKFGSVSCICAIVVVMLNTKLLFD